MHPPPRPAASAEGVKLKKVSLDRGITLASTIYLKDQQKRSVRSMVVENLFGNAHMNMHFFVGLPSCHYAFHEDETVIVKLEICFHT